MQRESFSWERPTGQSAPGAAAIRRHHGRDTEKDLDAQERGLLGGARLIQFVTAGVEYIPLGNLPGHVPIASNRWRIL